MGNAWRIQNELKKTITEPNPYEKRLLVRPETKWKDLVKKDVESLHEYTNWKKDQWIGNFEGVNVKWS